MAQNKTIRLFLMDGDPSGCIKCSLTNWSGVAYKIPLTALKKCNDDPDMCSRLQRTGVYFLFGTDVDSNKTVYVGQAVVRKNKKGALSRIQEPHSSIEWNEAVIFTGMDGNTLGATEVSYLENSFYNIVRAVGRYKVTNGNDPNPGSFSEETKSEMEEFIDYAKLVMSALGHDVLKPINPQSLDFDKEEPVLQMVYKNGKATGKRTSDGFVIFKGSTINPETTKSCPVSILNAREQYAAKIDPDTNELMSDILMTSPSAAAGFIGGASLNGYDMWHDSQGRSLKQIDER